MSRADWSRPLPRPIVISDVMNPLSNKNNSGPGGFS
jgi:hypothetical protein